MSNELTDLQKQTIKNLWSKFRKSNEAHERPALYLKFEPYADPSEGINDRFASKLGGHPFWPQQHQQKQQVTKTTPKYSRKHTSAENNNDDDNESICFMGDLRLLAQFNLQEISSENRRKLNVPDEDGILQFFVAPDDCWGLFAKNAGFQSSTTYRVKYWPAEIVSKTEKCVAADEFPTIPQETEENRIIGTCELPINMRRPCRVTFEKEVRSELWGFSDHNVHSKFEEFLRQEAPEYSEMDALELIMTGSDFNDPGAGSKLGGHPAFTQEDPRDSWKQEDKSLLFQLDSEGPVCVGDCGVMNFFNADGWTAKGEFGGTKYTWDCG